MVTDTTTLKLDCDVQLQRIEYFFDWAQRKYPFDSAELLSTSTIAATAATAEMDAEPANTSMANVVAPLDMRSRFLCTPPVRTKATPASTNPIMSNHLPWTNEQLQTHAAAATAAADGDKPALSDAVGGGNHSNKPSAFGQLRPTAAMNQSLHSRSGHAEAVIGPAIASQALSILSRVRNRCIGKATSLISAAASPSKQNRCDASVAAGSCAPLLRTIC